MIFLVRSALSSVEVHWPYLLENQLFLLQFGGIPKPVGLCWWGYQTAVLPVLTTEECHWYLATGWTLSLQPLPVSPVLQPVFFYLPIQFVPSLCGHKDAMEVWVKNLAKRWVNFILCSPVVYRNSDFIRKGMCFPKWAFKSKISNKWNFKQSCQWSHPCLFLRRGLLGNVWYNSHLFRSIFCQIVPGEIRHAKGQVPILWGWGSFPSALWLPIETPFGWFYF